VRNALAAGEGFGRYHADSAKTSPLSKNLELLRKSAAVQPVFSASDNLDGVNPAYAERPWRMVAGHLTSNHCHCAVVSDAPDGGLPDIPYAKVWGGGAWEAAEGRNRKLLEKHFARLKDKPSDDVPTSRQMVSVTNRSDLKIPDDLSIPAFLDRRPLPPLKEAA
jgi:hypothetical protein